ncbi:dynein regulatory complex protein 1 homolog [Tribolium castaneum]|uniref:dynein regulatory complex protein 1 homolog n=1 Tax=Tribolium castaneum TaxID=7070 RepID=UPI00046C2C87|nr:PREDICTED: dynein regulatory complex protein 1 homolog [Tribolium castaneum]|eukprot:XP_008196751.1 PREDICTED: dynein regulatory complex protein 1 homolog [Tribolium castaneum]
MEEEEVTDEENYEPQVFSKNPTERIAARRLRIQRRVEALRKAKEAQEAAKLNVTLEPEVTKTPIEIQIEKSIELLEKLVLEGDEYVTNVRVATEAREADRREREGIGKEKLLKELEDEAEAAAGMFEEIANKWGGILKYNDPLHISEDIQSQKEKCDELIRQKDNLIAELKEKIRKAEINFAIDQRKQIEDVNSIARRIENQIIVMRKAYRQELQMIEEVILAERQILIEANNKKWEELYKKRDQEEKANSELKSEDYWNFVKEMDHLNRDFQELYRATTIQLENDCDELQRELERIKTDAVMNSEKLDYNYQILKKREDENLIIRSQQKRRINKLQDVINNLRKKNNDYHTQTHQQIDKLTIELKKLTQNILDIERKADHIAQVNDEKFKKIWGMNKQRADQLFKRILEIDKTLYEQQLGLIWSPPEHKLPTRNELDSYKTALNVLSVRKLKSKSVIMETEGAPNVEPEIPEGDDIDYNKNYKKTLRHVLNLVGDKMGFLIEDDLLAILEPYLEQERTLVKVDNVFAALNINDRSDIDLLLEFFLPYMFCPICNTTSEKPINIDEESLLNVHEMDPLNVSQLTDNDDSRSRLSDTYATDMSLNEYVGAEREGGTNIDVGPLSVTLYDDNLKGECKGPELRERDIKDQDSKGSFGEADNKSNVPCQYQHPLVISSVYVLKALREFLAKYHVKKAGMPTMSARLAHKRSTVSRLVAQEDIESYWTKYTTLFPKEREQLWDSLLAGLKRYHELLKVRKLTSEEVVKLRKQNLELRRVFANYIDKQDIPY